jgi:Ca2+-binding RTX toxin-like protein
VKKMMMKKKMLPVQGVVIGALLMSIVWLVPSAAITATSSYIIPAAFATPAPPPATCEGETATISGTSGNDNIVGTPNRDVIVGFGGNDRILGLGGNDRICGDDGNDRIDGGPGDDRVFGLADNDDLSGGPGDDFIMGETGTDSIDGGPGFDKCDEAETKTNCEEVILPNPEG